MIEMKKRDLLNHDADSMMEYGILPVIDKMPPVPYNQNNNTVEIKDKDGKDIDKKVAEYILEGFPPSSGIWKKTATGDILFLNNILYHLIRLRVRSTNRFVGSFYAPLYKVVEVKKALGSITYSQPVPVHDEDNNPLNADWNLKLLESMFYTTRIIDVILCNAETGEGETERLLIGENIVLWQDKTQMAFAEDLPQIMQDELGIEPDED